MRLLGAVLAGGQATRFGSDKAQVAWRGRPLIDHVVAALARECEAVAVCGRTVPELISLMDRPAPGLGPLGGIAAALAYAAAHGFDAALTAPCDTPRLPPLCALLTSHPAGAYLADLPVVGCWPVSLATELDRHLAHDPRRSVQGWARAAGAVAVALPPGVLIANVNAPGDLAALDC